MKEIVGLTESGQGEANGGPTTIRTISASVRGKRAVLMTRGAAAALVPEMAYTPASPSTSWMIWTMCCSFRTTTLKTVSRICTVR
jgi:hypothetical protein